MRKGMKMRKGPNLLLFSAVGVPAWPQRCSAHVEIFSRKMLKHFKTFRKSLDPTFSLQRCWDNFFKKLV
jgi:hypothetical protein